MWKLSLINVKKQIKSRSIEQQEVVTTRIKNIVMTLYKKKQILNKRKTIYCMSN